MTVILSLWILLQFACIRFQTANPHKPAAPPPKEYVQSEYSILLFHIILFSFHRHSHKKEEFWREWKRINFAKKNFLVESYVVLTRHHSYRPCRSHFYAKLHCVFMQQNTIKAWFIRSAKLSIVYNQCLKNHLIHRHMLQNILEKIS